MRTKLQTPYIHARNRRLNGIPLLQVIRDVSDTWGLNERERAYIGVMLARKERKEK